MSYTIKNSSETKLESLYRYTSIMESIEYVDLN